MSFKVERTPKLDGKVALVTGGNSGLGLASVKAFASRGAHVLLAARDRAKAEKAIAEVLGENPSASVEFLHLDLASQKNIRAAADSVSHRFQRLDLLMNNAGLMAMPEMQTEDGFESQFGVNHLGHWALTGLLMDNLLAADSARIITVTSSAHHLIPNINFDDPHMRTKYSPWSAYSQSKLANYFFALGLHNLFTEKKKSAMSFLAHPGLSHTNLQIETQRQGAAGSVGKASEYLAAKVGMEPDVGALPQIRAALDPRAKSGEFYAPRYFVTGAPVTRPFLRPFTKRDIAKLWQLSERETGIAIRL